MSDKPKNFSERLREWRGKRLQKEAAAALQVALSTYRNWEQGMNTPNEMARRWLEERMAEEQ